MNLLSKNQKGFTLIEASIAMVVLTIAVVGLFSAFTLAIQNNNRNALRAQSQAILQQELEILRSAKFTPGITDAKLVGGTKTPKTVNSANGQTFNVQIVVDDDPFVSGVQINAAKTIKEITVNISSISSEMAIVNAVPTTVVFRRVRAN